MSIDVDQYRQLTRFLSFVVSRCLNDQSDDGRYSYLMLDQWMKVHVDQGVYDLLRTHGEKISSAPRGLREYFQLISALAKILVENRDVLELLKQDRKSIYVPVAKPSNDIQSYLNDVYAGSGLRDSVRIVLHGSYADNTATAFSDVDDWVLVGEEVFQNFELFCATKKMLSKLSFYFQKIDPTQHHGHWIFNVFDLDWYERPIMPEVVFENAVSFGLPCEIELRMAQKESLTFREIRTFNVRTVKNGMEKILSSRINHYQLKEMVSSLSLLAPLHFQVNGKVLSKRAAFQALQDLPPEFFDAFQWSTSIREQWQELRYHQVESVKARILRPFIHNRNGLQRKMQNSDLFYRRDEIYGWSDRVRSSIEAMVKDMI